MALPRSAVTFANASATSSRIPVALTSSVLCGLITPAGMEGVRIRFETTEDAGDTFRLVVDTVNLPIEVTIDANDRHRTLDPTEMLSVQDFRLRTTDAAGTDVPQTGAVEVEMCLAPR